MAQQKKRKKNSGYHGSKPAGMNYMDMLQWQQSLVKKTEEFAKDETQRVLADRQSQRMEWIYKVSLNEKFGFDAHRFDELDATVKEMSDEYKRLVEEYDQDYADETLRLRVCQMMGRDIPYLYEDQYPINMDRASNPIANLRESESRIY